MVKGSSMEEVASGLGCSVSHLYRLLAGERGPGLQIAAQALAKYGIPIEAWSQRGMSTSESRRLG